MEEKMAALEASTSESVKKMEEMLEVLQREVSALSNQPAPAPAAGADPWGDAAEVMGVESAGVTVDGDSYSIERAWLVRQLRALALTGKGPETPRGKKRASSSAACGPSPSRLPRAEEQR